MDKISIERLGGIGGFGLPNSRVKSDGEFELSDLEAADRDAIEALFKGGGPAGKQHPDGFRYRLTRQTRNGPHTVEVPEDRVPEAVRGKVTDRLE